MSEKKEMTVAEAGRKGGCKVRDERLVDYSEIGKKGGSRTFELYGSEHFAECGRKGGHATVERHGSAHYEKIGHLGGQRFKELVKRGKALEEEG